jgi:hypothetical protein
MEKIKAMDRPIHLSIGQWGDILKCLKRHYPDNKIIIMVEKGLREQVDLAVSQYRDQLYDEIFNCEDSEAETQEMPLVKSEFSPQFNPSIQFVEDELPALEEEDCECHQFGKTELCMMAGLCLCCLGLVAAIVI